MTSFCSQCGGRGSKKAKNSGQTECTAPKQNLKLSYFSPPTVEESKKAFDALCHSTHLYGRRLVLEWADAKDEETTIGELRAKTAVAYGEGGPPSKKLKKSDIAESLVLGKSSK